MIIFDSNCRFIRKTGSETFRPTVRSNPGGKFLMDSCNAPPEKETIIIRIASSKITLAAVRVALIYGQFKVVRGLNNCRTMGSYEGFFYRRPPYRYIAKCRVAGILIMQAPRVANFGSVTTGALLVRSGNTLNMAVWRGKYILALVGEDCCRCPVITVTVTETNRMTVLIYCNACTEKHSFSATNKRHR